jgi:hypothetical protein
VLNFWGVTLYPRPDGDVVDRKSALGKELFHIAIRSEKRRYQPTARRTTSGSNCRHLNRAQTEDARRSILPAYHGVTAKLQHFPSHYPHLSFSRLFAGLWA